MVPRTRRWLKGIRQIMIDIVFSDSACGSLKMAQSYGLGPFKTTTDVELFVCSGGESEASEEEVRAARQEWDEKELLAWNRATPMGGDPTDVYGFALNLSTGDISENPPGEKRCQSLEWYYSIFPSLDGEPVFTEELIKNTVTTLKEVCSRISTGEPARIWYSHQPDELCGMIWFASQLSQLELQADQVFLIQLPDWKMGDDGIVTMQFGWGGVYPGDWQSYLHLQKPITSAYCTNCAQQWRELQAENAPLRASLNGRLVSVPERIYDAFIVREIEVEPEEFHEATVIGRILGKYELGIGAAWLAHRIEAMIRAGALTPVTQPLPSDPIYHRRLRKCQNSLHQYKKHMR